jgi:transcriptional regulator with XRE-family HTH domain
MFYKTNMDQANSPRNLAEQLGSTIRSRRATDRRTQSELASALGVRRQTIADLENGKNVGLHVALAVLQELNISEPLVPKREFEAPDVNDVLWPAQFAVVKNWSRFEEASRARLEREMRDAPSAEANRRDAFFMNSMDVRGARIVHAPSFEDADDF